MKERMEPLLFSKKSFILLDRMQKLLYKMMNYIFVK